MSRGRPSSVSSRITDWETWRDSLTAKDESKLSKGKGCPVAVDLMNLKYVPLVSQAKFHANNSKFRGFSAAIGCVAGETRLDGAHSQFTVAELVERGIAPLVETLIGPMQAKVPYIKGIAALLEVRLLSGRRCLVTADHLVFERHLGWCRTGNLREHCALLVSAVDRHQSIADVCQRASQRDALRCLYTGASYLDDCCLDYHQYDEQLHSALSSAVVQIPSPIYAHEHNHHLWCTDDLAYKSSHSQTCQLSDHHSMMGYCEPIRVDTYRQDFLPSYKRSESWTLFPISSQSAFSTSQRQATPQSDRDFACKYHLQECGQPDDHDVCEQLEHPYLDYTVSEAYWDLVVSINYVRTDYFYDLEVPLVGHYTANGIIHHNSGKSMALAYEALYLAAISPNCMGYITAPTHSMLRDAAQRAIFKMLQEEGIEYKYTGGEQDVITFMRGDPNFDATNGRLTPSQIQFRSTSNYDRLRGPNLAWFGMDELTYCDAEAWAIMIGRIRDPGANQLNGFGCWTPKGFDWVHKMFINEETRIPNSFVVRATPGENFHLESDFYSTVSAQYDDRFAQQEIMGEYLSVFQGQVYHAYDQRQNVTTDVRYVPGLPIAWTLDFNVDPFCSVLLQRVDGPHQSRAGVRLIKPWTEIWAFDEIVLRDGNTFKMCEEFGKRTKPLLQLNRNRLVIDIYGDATGARRQTSAAFGSDHQIIRQWFVEHSNDYDVHWHIEEQNPPVRARVNAVNAALCDAGGTHHLKINPACAILMNDLQTVSWRKGDEGTTMDEGSKRELTHSSDALGYYITSMSGYAQTLEYMRKRMDGF